MFHVKPLAVRHRSWAGYSAQLPFISSTLDFLHRYKIKHVCVVAGIRALFRKFTTA